MKEYIKPEILVHRLSYSAILAGSGNGTPPKSNNSAVPYSQVLSKQSSFSFEDEELDEDY